MSDTTGRYLSPGVYVEEVPSGSRPIEGVGTAVAAFVGLAPAGPGIVVLRALVLAGLVSVVLAAVRRRSSGRH
jgi:phage tail sheath protein FI